MYNPVRLPFINQNIPSDVGSSYRPGSAGTSYQSDNTYNSNTGVFTHTQDGIRVHQDGTYLVTAHVKGNNRNQADTFALGVNGSVTNTTAHNTLSPNGTGNQVTSITTQLKLKAGDEVSLNLVSPGTVKLISWTSTNANPYTGGPLAGYGGGGGGGRGLTEVAGSPSIGMSMVKIA